MAGEALTEERLDRIRRWVKDVGFPWTRDLLNEVDRLRERMALLEEVARLADGLPYAECEKWNTGTWDPSSCREKSPREPCRVCALRLALERLDSLSSGGR
jgi:hypothetical protein